MSSSERVLELGANRPSFLLAKMVEQTLVYRDLYDKNAATGTEYWNFVQRYYLQEEGLAVEELNALSWEADVLLNTMEKELKKL